MRKLLRVALTVIASSFLGLCVGLAALYLLTDTISEGGFTRWRSLGSPPDRIVTLLGIGSCAPGHALYVETVEGRTYRYCPRTSAQWVEMTPPQYIHHQECVSLPHLAPSPPHPPTACVEIAAYEWVTDRTQFALLDDGAVWIWHLYFGFDSLLTFICSGPLVGGLAGVLIAQRRERRRRRDESTANLPSTPPSDDP